MKRFVIIFFVLLYIYTLTFELFLTESIRIPTPILFSLPLLIFFGSKDFGFLYLKEALLIIFLILFYNASSDKMNSVIANLIVTASVICYFNFFVGKRLSRFNTSVAIFIGFLLLSTFVMLLNQLLGSSIISLRSFLIDAEVRQSPSGISATIFTFGYQLAPVVTFLLVYVCCVSRNIFLISAIFIFGLFAIYLGLQRSVLFAYFVSVLIFFLFYYRAKSVLVIGFVSIVAVLLYSFAISDSAIGSDNILAKNERAGGAESRTGLFAENLNIIMDYPFGLVFYGKSWSEVVKGNLAFPDGLTSHNAYLMFITYFGPFVGLGFLLLLYRRIYKIILVTIKAIHVRENAILISLCFAFIAVTLNALFHNAWLLNANGPTIFLYFSIIQLYEIKKVGEFEQANNIEMGSQLRI